MKKIAVATLILGGTPQEQRKAAEEWLLDLPFSVQRQNICFLEKKGHHILIEEARRLSLFLQQKSAAGEGRVGVIFSAEDLTTEAQNALLKTTEELPEGSSLLLTAHDESRLLPTLVSRCIQKRLPARKRERREETEEGKTILELLSATLAVRLDYLDGLEHPDRERCLSLLDAWITQLGKLLSPERKKSSFVQTEIIRWIRLGFRLRLVLQTTEISPKEVLSEFLLSGARLCTPVVKNPETLLKWAV